MPASALTFPARTEAEAADIDRLLELAMRGITPMFCPEENLFCYRLKQTPGGLVREGISHRYSIMTLLGLHRAASAGLECPLDTAPILRAVAGNTEWVKGAGDLGLLLWLSSLSYPEYVQPLLTHFRVGDALQNFPDAQEGRTMELAWFLSGLSHLKLSGAACNFDLRETAERAWRLLDTNRGSHGLFGHQREQGTTGILRGRIGTFADQVYPIYALVRFAQAFQEPAALKMALECADSICRLQGPQGQWWWHYDSRTGRVLSQYPVYSVHQDAMAPLALLPLGEVAKRDYTIPLLKGLAWISGANELGTDLRDFSNGLVWRSLYQSRPLSWVNEGLNFAGLSSFPAGLKITYEDRPYHLGWALYAFAGQFE
jgi:hypothetical protein